jgi:chromosome segregation ATPase
MTRDTKTALVAELQSKIEELSADINELALKITQTQTAISEIAAAMSKATAERGEEKEKNTQTIDDGKIAQAATQRAMQVLKEYYDKAANQVDLPEAEGPIKYDPRSLQILSKSAGGALVQEQQRVPGAPEMESGKYTGMENGGILGMLEIIESDFADLIASTTASEAESARVFEQFTNDSSQNTAVKNTELKHRKNKQTQKQSDLQQAKNDLKSAQKELTAATDYWAKLKPDCVEEAMSYADKKAAREEEIESLQDALGILSQGDIA